MSGPILSTKLYTPPPRPKRVERMRLIHRLEEGLRQGRRLTLISAPAGFGKSTLISEWISASVTHRCCAWVSLDRGDNDPVQFLRYLIAAVQQVDGSLGQAILPALQSPQPPPLPVLVEQLINDITLKAKPILLVLDDYHAISDVSVHQLVQLLLERQPETLHLAILTREDPPLPIPRLRAREQVTEIRERELRFTEPEAAEFLRKTMGLEIEAEAAATLAARTEGWIAGLQLAAIALQEYADADSTRAFVAAFAGSDRYIVDYLVSEVLFSLPDPVRNFLMYTSVLERLCSGLCDEVVYGGAANGKSREILESLEHANMFIVPLDNQREWYRYHHLFADLLRHSLQVLAGGQTAQLHRRASGWLETHGFVEEAVQHAFKTQDWVYAAELVERHANDRIARSQVAMLHDWCAAFPEAVIAARPGLCIFTAWSMMLSYRTDLREAVAARLEQAEQALSDPDLPARAAVGPGGAPVSLRDWVTGQVCAIRSQLLLAAFHDPVDPQEVIALSLKSLELLPEVEKTVRSTCAITLAHAYLMMADVAEAEKALAVSLGMALEAGNFFSAVTAYFYQARIAYHLGRLERCIEICQEGLEKLTPNFQHPDMEFPAIRSLYVPQAVVRLERNELAEAERLLSRATNLVGWAPWVELIAYTSLARLWELRGDPARVLETLKRMEKNGPQLAYCAEALRTLYQARTHADDEHTLALAAIWAGTHAPDRGERQVVLGIGPFQVDAEYTAYLAWLHIQILTGQPQAALEFIAPVLADAHKKGLRQRVIELSVAQALACIAAGEPQPAREALKPALALAEPEGFRNSFNQGRELARLLGDLAVRGIARETIQRIIAVWQPQGEPGKGDGSAAGRPAKMPELVDPLSDRELEVLRLLEKGLTIPEIAKVLYLSPNTLKAHSQNIYSKLDVHNRLQAVRRAKELGYLKDEG